MAKIGDAVEADDGSIVLGVFDILDVCGGIDG
jgi:hypothetical protein